MHSRHGDWCLVPGFGQTCKERIALQEDEAEAPWGDRREESRCWESRRSAESRAKLCQSSGMLCSRERGPCAGGGPSRDWGGYKICFSSSVIKSHLFLILGQMVTCLVWRSILTGDRNLTKINNNCINGDSCENKSYQIKYLWRHFSLGFSRIYCRYNSNTWWNSYTKIILQWCNCQCNSVTLVMGKNARSSGYMINCVYF